MLTLHYHDHDHNHYCHYYLYLLVVLLLSYLFSLLLLISLLLIFIIALLLLLLSWALSFINSSRSSFILLSLSIVSHFYCSFFICLSLSRTFFSRPFSIFSTYTVISPKASFKWRHSSSSYSSLVILSFNFFSSLCSSSTSFLFWSLLVSRSSLAFSSSLAAYSSYALYPFIFARFSVLTWLVVLLFSSSNCSDILSFALKLLQSTFSSLF